MRSPTPPPRLVSSPERPAGSRRPGGLRWLWLLTLLGVVLIGCASGPAHADDPAGVDAPPAPADAARVVVESEGEELRDCITGCERALSPDEGEPQAPLDLRGVGRFELRGQLDDACHPMTLQNLTIAGPDIDTLALYHDPRAMLEFNLEPGDGLRALLVVYEGPRVIAYAEAGVDGEPVRARFAVPTVPGLPFIVVVQDADNIPLLMTPPLRDCARFDGGAGLDYALTIEASDFAPTELGALADQPLRATDQRLPRPGDLHYYRFRAPVLADFDVTVTRAGDSDLTLQLVALNTVAQQLSWRTLAVDGQGGDPDDGALSLDQDAFKACHDMPATPDVDECEGVEGEFVLVVIDHGGRGDPSYAFDVTVTPR